MDTDASAREMFRRIFSIGGEVSLIFVRLITDIVSLTKEYRAMVIIVIS